MRDDDGVCSYLYGKMTLAQLSLACFVFAITLLWTGRKTIVLKRAMERMGALEDINKENGCGIEEMVRWKEMKGYESFGEGYLSFALNTQQSRRTESGRQNRGRVK